MGMHAQKAFAKHNETSNVEDAVWGKVVQLHATGVQEASDEIMEGKRQAPRQDVHEDDTLAGARGRGYLVPGASHSAARRRRQTAIGSQTGEMAVADGGRFPVSLHLLRRSVVASGASLLALAHGEEWEEEEIGSSGECKEEEEEWQRE